MKIHDYKECSYAEIKSTIFQMETRGWELAGMAPIPDGKFLLVFKIERSENKVSKTEELVSPKLSKWEELAEYEISLDDRAILYGEHFEGSHSKYDA